jgi:uncharacterized protein YvpB
MKNRHMHYIRLGATLLLASFLIVFITSLWYLRLISLPAQAIHLGRYIDQKVSVFYQSKPISQLNVLFHKQEHSLSCEAATLKMVLDYHGLNFHESDLLKLMPFDTTPRTADVWGDPDKGFVGDIDGKMGQDGYGIHANALAELARNWKKAEVIKNGTAQLLAKHISEGRPVITWGFVGRGIEMNWKHTRVVYGYKGTINHPEGFLVIDPIYGPAYWEVEKFMKNWSALGYSGVVIYS